MFRWHGMRFENYRNFTEKELNMDLPQITRFLNLTYPDKKFMYKANCNDRDLLLKLSKTDFIKCLDDGNIYLSGAYGLWLIPAERGKL